MCFVMTRFVVVVDGGVFLVGAFVSIRFSSRFPRAMFSSVHYRHPTVQVACMFDFFLLFSSMYYYHL